MQVIAKRESGKMMGQNYEDKVVVTFFIIFAPIISPISFQFNQAAQSIFICVWRSRSMKNSLAGTPDTPEASAQFFDR